MKKTICLITAVLMLAVLFSACGMLTGIVYVEVDGSSHRMSEIIEDDSLLAKTVMQYESAGSVISYRGSTEDGSAYSVEFGSLTGVRGYYEVTTPGATVLTIPCTMESGAGTCKLVVASDDGSLYTLAQGSLAGESRVDIPAGTTRVAVAGDGAQGSLAFGSLAVDDPNASIKELWAGGFLSADSLEEAEKPA